MVVYSKKNIYMQIMLWYVKWNNGCFFCFLYLYLSCTGEFFVMHGTVSKIFGTFPINISMGFISYKNTITGLVVYLLIVKTPTQPQLNLTKLGLTRNWLYTTTTTTTHPPPTTTGNSMSAISQLLLVRFWWNFKGSFLGASRTDSNYQVNICLGNICPGDICPHQEYLSSYWPDFDETLMVASWNHL